MKHNSVKRLVGMAMLIAIVVVLQSIAKYLTFGNISFALVLVPIIIGAAIYGKLAGAILGAVFGLMTFFGAMNSPYFDGLLFHTSPVLCFLICILKAVAAGYCSGLVYQIGTCKSNEPKRVYVSSLLAALTAPIVNTGIFCVGVLVFFYDVLSGSAMEGGKSAIAFLFLVLVGVNFLVELAINLICAPVINTVIRVYRKNNK